MTVTALTASPQSSAQDPRVWAEILRADGYCIIPNAAPSGLIDATWGELRDRFEKTPFCEGDFYGWGTKRFGGVLKRSKYAADLVMHPLILRIVDEILRPFCDSFQLNLTQALEIHPGQAAQAPHRDEDMWGGPKGEVEYLVNVMWPFSPYTAANGATRVYLDSHRVRDDSVFEREPIAAEMDPGSVLIFLGSTAHGGGPNTTRSPRTGMIVSYCLGWLKPFENQWLVYPPQIARGFSPELARMVGYQQHRPNLGNYEGQCPSVLLRGIADEPLAAIDNLQPAQAAAVAEWRQSIGAH